MTTERERIARIIDGPAFSDPPTAYNDAADGSRRRRRNYALAKADSILALSQAPDREGWRPMESAPKNRTDVLLRFKDPVPHKGREAWHGLSIVAHHPGLATDGFDVGWNIAGPVGYGGFPDDWFVGWEPLPPAVQPAPSEGEG